MCCWEAGWCLESFEAYSLFFEILHVTFFCMGTAMLNLSGLELYDSD